MCNQTGDTSFARSEPRCLRVPVFAAFKASDDCDDVTGGIQCTPSRNRMYMLFIKMIEKWFV